jgi:F-type H+-transporting ATPase subunit c
LNSVGETTSVAEAVGKGKERETDMSTVPLLATAAEIGGNLLGGNVHVGLAAAGAAIGVGLIGMAASTAVGRNPGAATKILVQSILAIAFAEAIVFYALFLVKA